MKKIAVYAGTFDPITLGHMDIIRRATKLFDEVIIGVAKSYGKSPLFDNDRRLEMVSEAIAGMDGVCAKVVPGLTVDFAHTHQASYLLRGLRTAVDFDYEAQICLMNKSLHSGIETVYLITDPEYGHISSSIVREIINLKEYDRLASFLPAAVIDKLK